MIDSEMIWGFVKVIIVLICLTPLIYYVTRWYGKLHNASTTITVTEKVSLGGNKAFYVVEWEEMQYLVAITSQTVTLIDKKVKFHPEKGGEGNSPQ